MVPVYRYAVSYAHGRDEAWVARFLDELRRRLDTGSGPRFHRLVPPPAAAGGPEEGSYGVGTADIVLALCSPAYFNEGPAQRDWAVLALRRSLGQARTGVAPQPVLPLVWEPVDRRLPGPVETADVFSAGQPAEYRSLGLALLTMQAPRYRAVLDRVLDGIAARMRAMAAAGAPAPELDDGYGFAGEAPDALSADDAAFTERFRAEVTASPLPARPITRTLVLRGSVGSQEVGGGYLDDGHVDRDDSGPGSGALPSPSPLPVDLLPDLGRRILLVDPSGSGHSTELARLVAGALADRTPGRARTAPRPSLDAVRERAGVGESADWEETDGQDVDGDPAESPGTGWPLGEAAPVRPPWGCRIPFVLSARSGALPRLDGMVPTLAPSAAAAEPAGWAARQLRSGRAFLAVDDLDAVPAGNRAAVWEWLLRLLEAHPRAPCVIATNGTGVPWSRLGGDFRIVGLEPLSPTDLRALLNSGAAQASGDRGDLADRAALPAPTLGTDPLLAGVAGRPAAAVAMLRAAAASVTPGQVPRHRLLRAGVSAVWRRPREDTAGPAALPAPAPAADQVPDSVLRAASGRLAVAALGLDGSRIPLSTALNALRAPRSTDSTAPERLLAALADRAGVVFRPGPDTVAFPSPGVRTFLAAHHLVHTPGTDTDALLRRHPSPELAELLAQLRAAETGTGTARSVLAAPGGPPRRLSAGSPPRPAVRGAGVRRVGVRSSAEVRALLRAGTAVPELRCSGPVDGLSEALPKLPGLRSLVLADDPSLVALPELGGCRSLRSVRVLRCPNLRDLTALESSAVMFLDVDPWPDLPVPECLRRAFWLSRVDLVTAGPRTRPAVVPAVPGTAFPEIRIRPRPHG
ncbi:large ATP-binding protein [Streptomyces griseorubiginosus]|uniref:large ATP-binding protein n=1 Tax=Streptomyces griseorubiginosus TaxID=67304 RepID=UPI002E81ED4C|nr:large ATP-binding protein [Streptomyces griseorubiginosus]WUB45873.1 toll/interleukin-1 receptor domain-containing protein [Streptomyces griseorubiginosus]WUB54393.1 toll/interleukin-1 receptor domain-containing protein [Streptomyces griseorubiginosus]